MAEWARQICGAIRALHSKNICHRDVKPDNFMVSGADPSLLKLSDFGLATFLQDGQRLKQKCGTPAFMAPELHNLPDKSSGYRFEVDMWAVGVVLCCLVNGGRHPFVDHIGRLNMRSLLNGSVDFPSQDPVTGWMPFLQQKCCPAGAADLCKRMLDKHPASRITAQEALEAPWLLRHSREAPTPNAQDNRAKKQLDLDAKEATELAAREKKLHYQNSALQAKLDDQQAQIDVSKQRERILLEMVGEKKCQAPKTLCAPSASAQGRLPNGAKCRYWSASQKTWLQATVSKFNEDDGTYDLNVKARASLANIAPRSDVQAEEAWPRGTFVSYRSSSSGKEVPAVIISFQVPAAGPSTYNLDVRDGAEVDRIRARIGKIS